MSVLQAAKRVLQEARKPLHYKEITRRMIDRGLWQTDGKTPDATVSSAITGDIKKNGIHALFRRINDGVYALGEWNLPGVDTPSESAHTEDGTYQPAPDISAPKSLSFTDAAEQVLKQFSGNKPMHYREITRKALELGLMKTKGLTPEATLYSQTLAEIRRQSRKGKMPRFNMQGSGFVSLSNRQPLEAVGLVFQIEQHNQQARKKFHERLLLMRLKEFKELIGKLLHTIGFQGVTVTDDSGDNGIDIRGTLVIGDVIRVNMAVQVKKWAKDRNIQRPDVQQVRGSLGAHDQGLIITTSGFSQGAIEEAQRSDAVPVALMNGDQLVALLVEYNIGIVRELGETDE